MAVGLQVVDLDGVIPALLDPLLVRVVPEDRDRAARIKGKRLMARDLDQLGGFDCLAAAGLKLDRWYGAL